MSAARARSMGAKSILFLGLTGLAACSATTTKPVKVGPGGTGYDIECVRINDCWAEAKRACGGPFHSVQKSTNTIAESDMPGLNARTQENTLRHYVYGIGLPGGVPDYGPGIESDDPMPITQVVVVCNGT